MASNSSFFLFSRAYEPKRDGERKSLKKGDYCILEKPIWSNDVRRGLARYIGDEILNEKVDRIVYKITSDGYVKFTVGLTHANSENEKIEYNGRTCTIKEAVCRYISGQISDGWGEDGILVLDYDKDKVKRVECSTELYDIDYEAIREKVRRGIFDVWDEESSYKKVTFDEEE